MLDGDARGHEGVFADPRRSLAGGRRLSGILCAIAARVGGRVAAHCAAGGVPWDLGHGAAVEGFQIEDASQEGPREGEVGDEDGGAALAHVPVCPLAAERVSEAVIFIQDGGEDDEDA